jgi:hypothetical protein
MRPAVARGKASGTASSWQALEGVQIGLTKKQIVF